MIRRMLYPALWPRGGKSARESQGAKMGSDLISRDDVESQVPGPASGTNKDIK